MEESQDANWKVNAAGYLAIASSIMDPGEGPAGTDRRRRDADHAMNAFREAVALGWSGLAYLKRDPDLDSLRGRADFQLLMMDMAMPAEPFAPAD